MRTMVRGPLPRRSGKVVLAFFYVYFVVHWATGLVLFGSKLGFGYRSVVRYYLGDPDRFLNPRSLAGLLEVTHFHLFAYGFFFLVVAHLLLLNPLPRRLQAALIGALGTGLCGDLAAGWLVRYVHPGFAWLKLGSFGLLQFASLAVLVTLVLGLVRPARARPPGPGRRQGGSAPGKTLSGLGSG